MKQNNMVREDSYLSNDENYRNNGRVAKQANLCHLDPPTYDEDGEISYLRVIENFIDPDFRQEIKIIYFATVLQAYYPTSLS